mgnify:CR=1 FL=1
MNRPIAAMLLVLPIALISGCGGKKDPATEVSPPAAEPPAVAAPQSLYDGLGGEAAEGLGRLPWVEAHQEAAARTREATIAAEMAQEEEKRLESLHQNGLISDLEVIRAQKLSEARRSEVQVAEFAAGRVARDLNARHQSRVARAARLRNDLAVAQATHAQAGASSNRLGYDPKIPATRVKN